MKEKISALCDTYFNPRPNPRTHMAGGGCNPRAISPLIKIELLDKD